jgi:hypothetical protein
MLFIAYPSQAYTPFWDFREWDKPNQPIYEDYMKKFAKHGITALILINKETLPPFERVEKFLADANRKGISVWVRTNRVTPKRGIPGVPNGTLDFALNKDIQVQVLEYLDQLAALSKKYMNFKGLIIGGEEIVGAHINKDELLRWDNVFYAKNGFHMTGMLTDQEKITYFDWVQEKNNLWYGKIWDYLHTKYPSLDLFIYPSRAAIGEHRYSYHPRPAYWDIYDLVINKQKKYKIIVNLYNITNKYGPFITGADTVYLRDVSKGTVPIFIVHQCHIALGESYAPKISQILSDIFASLVNGAEGIGFWPIDSNTKKDVYYTNKERWNALFNIIETGRLYSKYEKIKPNIYILKPRYTKYLTTNVNESSFDTFAGLYTMGFFVGFVLEEEAKKGILPPNANIFYIPLSYKFERPEAIENLKRSGKIIFSASEAQRDFDLFRETTKSLATPMFMSLNKETGNGINLIVSPEAVLFQNSSDELQSSIVSFLTKDVHKTFSGKRIKVSLVPNSVIVVDSSNIEFFRYIHPPLNLRAK